MKENQKIEYFKNVNSNIEKFGFHITYVIEEIGFTPFGYSTGIFKNFSVPELIISGLPNGLTNQLITNYAEEYKSKTIPLNTKIDSLIDRFSVYMVEIDNSKISDHVLSSIKFYENDKFKYIQLVFPDLDGNFPGESNYNYDQELFFESNID